MRTSLTIQLDYRSEEQRWDVGAISKTDGDLELCCSEPCSPFTSAVDVHAWASKLMATWMAPPLHSTPSESLHDAWAAHP